MKRGAPLRRVPFRRKTVGESPSPLAYEGGDIGELRAAAVPHINSLRRGVIKRVDSKPLPAPKSVAKRCPALLEMARGRHCLFAIPGICRGGTETTVAAHSNWSEHGKGGARKADEQFSAWACAGCHEWLDQGQAAADAKRLAFQLAHIDQVLEWRRIAQDPSEPARFRKAAAWALRELGALP